MPLLPDHTAIFQQHRPRLFGIAYRMLGSVEDAEDLVQETYLRWEKADRRELRIPEAWLVSVISRLSIDRLRQARVRREQYIGDWLPEPVIVDGSIGPDRAMEIASDLSMAFLLMLERLAPEERAAFLLREVFETDYDEIARALDKSEATCRQLVHRARERVRRDRARFTVAPDVKKRLLESALRALQAGDKEGLLSLMTEDATWTTDGGGKITAARNILHSAEHIVRFLLGIERKSRNLTTHRIASVNGEPAIVTYVDTHLYAITSIDTDGTRITAAYRVINPDKLRRAAETLAAQKSA